MTIPMRRRGHRWLALLAVGTCALALVVSGEARLTDGVFCSTSQPSSPNISGEWSANDGGTYWIRHIGTCIWWAGFSGPNNTPTMGTSFSNVLFGTTKGTSIDGLWAEVPRGGILGSGSLQLTARGSKLLFKRSQSGSGFGGSLWKRVVAPISANVVPFRASVECSLLPTAGPVDRLGKPISLTGRWAGPQAATYWIRQLGSCVWWIGFSPPTDSPTMGKSFSNVLFGATSTQSAGVNRITGSWADVPRGRTLNGGRMVLSINSSGTTLRLTKTSGPFKGSSWTKLP